MALEKNKIQGRADELDTNIEKLKQRLLDLEKEKQYSCSTQCNARQNNNVQCFFLSL